MICACTADDSVEISKPCLQMSQYYNIIAVILFNPNTHWEEIASDFVSLFTRSTEGLIRLLRISK